MIKIHGVTDISIEWMEEIPERFRHKNLRYLFLICTITFLAIAFWNGMLGFVLFAIPTLIVFLVMNANRCMDYEFHYFDEEFQVVQVKRKLRRKKVFDCNIERIDYAVDRFDKEANPKEFFGEDREEKVSTLFVNGERGREAIAFEMDSRFHKILEVTGKIR